MEESSVEEGSALLLLGRLIRFLKSLERGFDSLLKGMTLITCLILVFIALSVCLEVGLRYFFNRPQVWVIELSEYALLYITFLAAAWVMKAEGHITIDLITERLGRRKRSFLSVINHILCSAVSFVFFWNGMRVTWDYFSKKIYNPTILEIPTAAILIIIPIGGAFLFVQSLRGVCAHLSRYRESRASNRLQ